MRRDIEDRRRDLAGESAADSGPRRTVSLAVVEQWRRTSDVLKKLIVEMYVGRDVPAGY